MIKGITVKETNPININDNLTAVMERIATLMQDSVVDTVIAGGRPLAWAPVKSGRRPLFGTGRLWSTLTSEAGDSWAEVSWGAGLRYARIHQKGGIAGVGHRSNIIARPVHIQEEDVVAIRQMIVQQVLFSTSFGASVIT